MATFSLHATTTAWLVIAVASSAAALAVLELDGDTLKVAHWYLGTTESTQLTKDEVRMLIHLGLNPFMRAS